MLVKMSVELAEDSVNIDQIVERELSAALASELARAAWRGTQPLGILGQTGVTIVTNGTDGTAFSYDQLIDAAYAVA